MKSNREYIINFGNLKLGKHEYEFHVDDSFFKEYEYSLVTGADVNVNLTLDKETETLLVFEFKFKGSIDVQCDRCLDAFQYPVENASRILVKLTDKEDESGDEELIFLPLDEYEIDIRPFIYEFINLELPLRRVCSLAGKECNPEMLAYLSKEEKENSKGLEGDPRWEELKNLGSKRENED